MMWPLDLSNSDGNGQQAKVVSVFSTIMFSVSFLGVSNGCSSCSPKMLNMRVSPTGI